MVSSPAKSVSAYLKSLPPEKQFVVRKVRQIILKNLPKGFVETMNWGMISYEIPLKTYPTTYNGQPLSYAGLAAQKNYFAIYLMTVYGDPKKLNVLKDAFKKEKKKLDMGKCCVRFKKMDDLPLDAIGKMIAQTSVKQFIAKYEKTRTK